MERNLKNCKTRCYINDSNGIRNHNHSIRKRTLNHLVKLGNQLVVI